MSGLFGGGMTAEAAAALRKEFPDSEIGKLPKITCRDCSRSQGKVCDKHAKSKCQVCSNFITGAHLHLDYVGHAETTDRFLSVDPEWCWEPVGWSDDGTPLITRHGSNLVMWGRLTLCGTTRIGVGTAGADKDDAHKELIGDFLRNAGMRFGVALDLWRKSERAEQHDDTPHQEPQHITADWLGPILDRVLALPDDVNARLHQRLVDTAGVDKIADLPDTEAWRQWVERTLAKAEQAASAEPVEDLAANGEPFETVDTP